MINNQPLVSVVVPHVSGRSRLLRCLQAVFEQVAPETVVSSLEVLVVHDGSLDEPAPCHGTVPPEVGDGEWTAVERMSTPGCQIRVLHTGRQSGYGVATAMGIDQSSGRFLLLLNDDCFLERGCLEALVSFLDEEPGCAGVQPKLKRPGGNHFDPSGACGGYLDRHGYPFTRGRVFGTVEVDDGQYDEPVAVSWTCGACTLLRRSAVERVGGLPTHFTAHMEEIDLCWRLRGAGYWLACEPGAVAVHQGAATLKTENRQKTFLNQRNNLWLLRRNLKSGLGRVLFIRTLQAPLACFLDLASARPLHAVATLHGTVSGLWNSPWQEQDPARALSGRHSMASATEFSGDVSAPVISVPEVSTSGANPTYGGSVLAQYFLFGRRTFAELRDTSERGTSGQ